MLLYQILLAEYMIFLKNEESPEKVMGVSVKAFTSELAQMFENTESLAPSAMANLRLLKLQAKAFSSSSSLFQSLGGGISFTELIA